MAKRVPFVWVLFWEPGGSILDNVNVWFQFRITLVLGKEGFVALQETEPLQMYSDPSVRSVNFAGLEKRAQNIRIN